MVNSARRILDGAGLKVTRFLTGSYVTSLDMAGPRSRCPCSMIRQSSYGMRRCTPQRSAGGADPISGHRLQSFWLMMFSQGDASLPATAGYFAWVFFRYFGWGMACRAAARGFSSPPLPKAPARQLPLASRAKAGGLGRTRTCNETVMSGLDQQNALVFSGCFTSTICDLLRSFTFMRDPIGTPTGPEEQRRTADSTR